MSSSLTNPADTAVSVLAAECYDSDRIALLFARHMEQIGADALLRPGMKVVIKPNLLSRNRPERGVTTHPDFVVAAAGWLRSKGITDITLADSPGGPYQKSVLESIYKTCGMTDAAARAGIALNGETGYRTVQAEKALLCRSFSIIDPVADADLIVNLPRLKTHGMMMLTAGVKNLFGCIPGLQKPDLHLRFPEKQSFARMLVDLSLAVPPTITVLDAIVSMEGDGPASGTLRETGQTFASLCPYALDYAVCEFIGVPPASVYTVNDSLERGLFSPDKIAYAGEGKPPPLEDFQMPGSRPLGFHGNVPRFLRRPVRFLGEKVLSPVPVIKKQSCIGCGKCAESCAPRAVTVQRGKASIAYAQCIKCFCCHEMCPVDAIEIKRAGLLRK